MKKINALGKPCPIPVIEAKKAIRELKNAGGTVEIIVDNEVSVKNIEKMAVGLGLKTSSKKGGKEEFFVEIIVPENHNQQTSATPDSELVVAFGRKTMGDGDPDLGAILLKSYIYSLTELDTPPEHLLFFNSGAFLTNQASNALNDLQILLEKGTQISTCGACLDFYQIKETLAIGEITNMYGITEVMAQAKKVINF
ncbi:selenium metabolism protein YedF [Enterococcus moraviensis ATCC BAA-383]|uniref:Selenium metabolism protein YedF n=1 Tax=Enterococcus moraviensis ATCC BAA-383 TaxID=1158609 RepID=R2QU16_9ENTE|nr:sulfurtransferase-like selenium metabolism protein YedF [Enterococcus moraviensis]EOH98833.1 selenium metabolism protein YedF [Enterococcus moraviensis ATCC BAA-383]EOT71992.1 selenium metabolism protein YedF [Enterococcus moraviensis ATCC BAA-383]OJG68111.1 selenium metabolism protein YedF [Enterococcus moraviensis]